MPFILGFPFSVFIVFVELTECTDFWNNFAPPIQYLLICFGLTYFTVLLCLSLTISWSVRNFNAGCSFQGAKKKQELIVLPLNFVAGGVMGYMKSGSQKSLAAGGISALVLYFVHTQLPVRPVFASSIGLGMQNLFFSDPLAIFFAWKFDQPGFLT